MQGVRPFVELSTVTTVVSSLVFDDSFSSFPRASSLRFDQQPLVTKSPSSLSSCSSRFSFNVSQIDTLKPWTLTHTEVGPATPSPLLGPALLSPHNARSFSFALPAARTPNANWNTVKKASVGSSVKSFPSTPSSFHQRQQKENKENRFSAFLPSPIGGFFKKDGRNNGLPAPEQQQRQTGRESFRPFLGLYRAPYNELGYRAKMKPPLGGLISIVSPHIKRLPVAPNRY